MFRLVTLRYVDDSISLVTDRDGYTSEWAATQAMLHCPTGQFGVGEHDERGRLVCVFVDPICTGLQEPGAAQPGWQCLRPATVVRLSNGAVYCGECAGGGEGPVVDLIWLSGQLHVPVLPAKVSVRRELLGRAEMQAFCGVPDEAGRQDSDSFGQQVRRLRWRRELCAQLIRTPQMTENLARCVLELSAEQVIDLFPWLCYLGDELPDSARRILLSTTPVVAYRLGLWMPALKGPPGCPEQDLS